ncbi:hypothetical protein AB0A76_17055 [Streptomyces exfoliatus]|uniref:Uncharacterized protein n=1 Tax=Streptomyces exfoliatus TaxID=1905 RepID=A0ABV3CXJ9_STREX
MMSGHFTDRDERRWQRRAEEPVARPLPIGAWLRRLRRVTTNDPAHDQARDPARTPAPARRRPVEQA